MKYLVKVLAVAALLATPLILAQLGKPAKAAVALSTVQTCTPDQILACVNGAVTGVNNSAVTCTTTGCAGPQSGANASPPVITGTCATAGAGAGFQLLPGSTAFSGKVQCASTANTTLVGFIGAGKVKKPSARRSPRCFSYQA